MKDTEGVQNHMLHCQDLRLKNDCQPKQSKCGTCTCVEAMGLFYHVQMYKAKF